MKPNYKVNSRTTHTYQILVDGKPLSFRYLEGARGVEPRARARNTSNREHDFGCPRLEGTVHFHRSAPRFSTTVKPEPINDVRGQILGRAIALTCKATLRVERVLELLLLDEDGVSAERLLETGEQLQDILTLFALLPASKSPRESRACFPERLSTWQFEQLETVLEEIRAANYSGVHGARRHVLQSRVLPWLESMHNTLSLLQEMLPAQRC